MASKRPQALELAALPLVLRPLRLMMQAGKRTGWLRSKLYDYCFAIAANATLQPFLLCIRPRVALCFPGQNSLLLLCSYAPPADVVGVYDPMEIDTVVRHNTREWKRRRGHFSRQHWRPRGRQSRHAALGWWIIAGGDAGAWEVLHPWLLLERAA